MEPKDKVLKYMERYPRQPLRFGRSLNRNEWGQTRNIVPAEVDEDYIRIIKHKPVDVVVELVLELCNRYYSILEKTNRFQCRQEALRSAYDVYRHILHYRADISLLDVMDSIYRLAHEDTIGESYCCTVKKRVFCCDDDGIYDEWARDEFGLQFNDWKDINK